MRHLAYRLYRGLIWLWLSALVLGCAAPPAEPRGKIAFLLPETKTTRYESHDLPSFRAQLEARGFDVANNLIYSNANQDAAAQQQQAEAALTNGARVLVLDPVDSNSATAIAALARARGVPVIAYDRLITGSDAVDYYVSFNNREVGRLQGEALVAALAGVPQPTIVMLNGSPLDNNTVAYKEGAYAALRGRVVIAKEYDILDWSPDQAQEAMAGEQHMTVYKAIQLEAAAAAELAYLLWSGKTPDPDRFNASVDNGRIQVPAILLPPVAVTRANLRDTILADNFWDVTDVCAGEYAAACARAGLSLSDVRP